PLWSAPRARSDHPLGTPGGSISRRSASAAVGSCCSSRAAAMRVALRACRASPCARAASRPARAASVRARAASLPPPIPRSRTTPRGPRGRAHAAAHDPPPSPPRALGERHDGQEVAPLALAEPHPHPRPPLGPQVREERPGVLRRAVSPQKPLGLLARLPLLG